MKRIARILFGDVEKNSDFTGARSLRERWNALPGKRPSIHSGAIAIPYDTAQYHELISLYREISREHPIGIIIHEVEVVCSWSDLAKAELLEVEFGIFVNLAGPFEDAFDVVELCPSCHRSILRQMAKLQLDVKTAPEEDFFSVLHQGKRVALAVSAKARDVFERCHVHAEYAEVLDAEGKIMPSLHQLNVKDMADLSPRTKRAYGPKCESCGEYEGVYLPHSARKVGDEGLWAPRSAVEGKPMFLATQYGGKGQWLNDANRWKLASAEVFKAARDARLRGLGFTMAYLE